MAYRRRYKRRRTLKEPYRRPRIAEAAVLGFIITSCIGMATTFDKPKVETAPIEDVSEVPFRYSYEYQLLKEAEEAAAKQEAEELRQAIKAYEERRQVEAEEEFKQQEKELQNLDIGNEGAFYWEGAAKPAGFMLYTISTDYSDWGGYLPEVVQWFIFQKCEEYGVPYSLVLGQMEQESGYKYSLHSATNDVGYMQINTVANRERIADEGVDLEDPYENIELGIKILSELADHYDGNYAKALTAYNCGPTGAYKYYFSAGQDASPYAKSVMSKAARIEEELNATEN